MVNTGGQYRRSIQEVNTVFNIMLIPWFMVDPDISCIKDFNRCLVFSAVFIIFNSFGCFKENYDC